MKPPVRKNVWKMFDEISSTYDRINRILSFGFDKSWRKKMKNHLPKRDNMRLLDLATGTGDQIISLLEYSHAIDEAFGLDPSEKMLHIGKKKIEDKFYRNKVKMVHGSAEEIPFEENFFDLVTISFGIRNVESLEKTFSEVLRVLKPGGRFLVLEFSLPENDKVRKGHLFYLRNILPKIGGILSKSPKSYRYLNETIETFPYGEAFLRLLKKNGFQKEECHKLFFGAVSLYQADAP